MSVEEDSGLDREPDLQVLDLEQVTVRAGRRRCAGRRGHPDFVVSGRTKPRPGKLHATTAARCSAQAPSGTGLKQATQWPGSTSSSGGTSSRDFSTS